MKPTRRGLLKELEALQDVHSHLAVTGGVSGWTATDHKNVVFLIELIKRTTTEFGGIREATRNFVTEMRDNEEVAAVYLVDKLESKV